MSPVDADDAPVEDAVLRAAVARGVISAGQVAAARAHRDAASARGLRVGLLATLAASLDPARQEQLRRLRDLTIAQLPRPTGETTRLDGAAQPMSDATRWTDVTAEAFGRAGPPSELGGATRRFNEVLRHDARPQDQTFLSWDGSPRTAAEQADTHIGAGGPEEMAAAASAPTRSDSWVSRRGPVPGAVLGGRFEIVGELGRGGMGAVYRAKDRQANIEVALKLIPDELGSPERRERFLREGEVASGFDHPGIVRVHAVGEIEDRPFVACELVAGCRTLDQVLPGLGRSARVALIRDAARALGHAHARGVAHRDVKPGNLLIDERGRLKVADFGLALAADHDRLTRTGVQLGTPSFMAPEQVDAAREAQGPWTDVWALGVILYEALCGRRPFVAPSFAQLCMQITRGAPAQPRAIDPTIPAALEEVTLAALQVDPAFRPQDGEQMARSLDRALAERPSAKDMPTVRLAAAGAERVGPYELLRPLGEGGAGVVFEARGPDGHIVALKVLHPPSGEGAQEQVERFGRETRAASRLRHPNIAQVHDSGVDERGRHWMALELVTGESLQARLKRERTLDEAEATRIALAVCRALEHAHEQGVLHRDVKPHNILLSPAGPKLVDFGLARSAGDSTLTAKGAMLGTPGYLPPEQAEKQATIDHRADLYSLGATLYHLVCGRAPFVGDTLGQVLMAVLQKPPVRPSALRPGLSPALETIILTCLEKQREDRYPDAASLAADLERALRGQPVTPLGRGAARSPPDAAEAARQDGLLTAAGDRRVAPVAPPRAGTDRRMLALATGVVMAALAAAAVIVWRTNEAAEQKAEVERLAREKAVADAELERLRADAAERERLAAEEKAEAAAVAARAREEQRERERAGAAERSRLAAEERGRAQRDPDRERTRSPATLRLEREVQVLGLRPWLARRLAAARLWSGEAPAWSWSVEDSEREAQLRRVPLVRVMLAPAETELPPPLRDRALLAELDEGAVLILIQERDKSLHDEVDDLRAVDHGSWPGNDEQVCPIARSAPCEIHDRCFDEHVQKRRPGLRAGERWRIVVFDAVAQRPVAMLSADPASPLEGLRVDATADGLRSALHRAQEALERPVLLTPLREAQAELARADLPEAAEPGALTVAADAFTPHLDAAHLGGAYERWAERTLERVVTRGRALAAEGHEAEVRAVLDGHPALVERIFAR